MGQGYQNAEEKKLRLFSTWEITKYLIPVAPAHFRRVLRQNPDLPQGHSETEGGAKWFAFDEVLRLRAFFAAEGSKAKNYRPYLTINGLAAADIVLVPFGASFLEFASTGRFFDMLHSTFSSIEDGENVAARALGLDELAFEWDAVRALITRYDGAQQAEMAALIQNYMGPVLSPYRQDFTALIGQAGEQVHGIYEADYRDFNRETYARGRATFDETYAAFKKLLIGIWRRDELAAQDTTS